MLADLWKRPSVAVVLAAAVVIVVFRARGELAIGVVKAPGSLTIGEHAPLVVKPERSGHLRSDAPRAQHGRVMDAMGFLVVGAEVSVPGQLPVRTDGDGAFTALLSAANAPLLVRARGLRSAWVNPSSGSPDALVVQLAPAALWDVEPMPPERTTAVLTGEGVVRGIDGKPLAGAFVTAAGSDVWSRTDEIGRYVLALPSPNTTVVVHHPDASGDGRGQAGRSEPLQLQRTSGAVPLPEVVAGLGSALRGTLRDGRGNPVSGASLQLRGEGLSRTIESGISGIFRVAGLLPGHYEIRPLGFRGALGRRQQVVIDQPFVDCELQLQPTTEQRLQVRDESGAPVARAFVATSFDGERRSVAQVDAEGFATIRVTAADADFEVRAADGQATMTVRRYEADSARLVVALP